MLGRERDGLLGRKRKEERKEEIESPATDKRTDGSTDRPTDCLRLWTACSVLARPRRLFPPPQRFFNLNDFYRQLGAAAAASQRKRRIGRSVRLHGSTIKASQEVRRNKACMYIGHFSFGPLESDAYFMALSCGTHSIYSLSRKGGREERREEREEGSRPRLKLPPRSDRVLAASGQMYARAGSFWPNERERCPAKSHFSDLASWWSDRQISFTLEAAGGPFSPLRYARERDAAVSKGEI